MAPDDFDLLRERANTKPPPSTAALSEFPDGEPAV